MSLSRFCSTSSAFLVLALSAALLAPRVAQAGISVEGSLTEDRIARPGESYRGAIAVRNNGHEPVEVMLYQTDYAFWADGRNQYGEPGSMPRSNARWVRLGQQQFLIQPGAVINAPYEVNVPDDQRLSGSYWSMIMVEPLSPRESSTRPRKEALQLTQVIRYAVQIATDIGTAGRRTLAFVNPVQSDRGGERRLSVDVENTGEHYLRPQLWMELYDAQGRAIRRIDSEKKRIYPGTSARFSFDLSALAAGRYRALIIADSGGDDLFGTQMSLELK